MFVIPLMVLTFFFDTTALSDPDNFDYDVSKLKQPAAADSGSIKASKVNWGKKSTASGAPRSVKAPAESKEFTWGEHSRLKPEKPSWATSHRKMTELEEFARLYSDVTQPLSARETAQKKVVTNILNMEYAGRTALETAQAVEKAHKLAKVVAGRHDSDANWETLALEIFKALFQFGFGGADAVEADVTLSPCHMLKFAAESLIKSTVNAGGGKMQVSAIPNSVDAINAGAGVAEGEKGIPMRFMESVSEAAARKEAESRAAESVSERVAREAANEAAEDAEQAAAELARDSAAKKEKAAAKERRKRRDGKVSRAVRAAGLKSMKAKGIVQAPRENEEMDSEDDMDKADLAPSSRRHEASSDVHTYTESRYTYLAPSSDETTDPHKFTESENLALVLAKEKAILRKARVKCIKLGF